MRRLLASPWHAGASVRVSLGIAHWWLAGELVAVMFVTVVSLLLNTTGVEMATRRDADIDGELKALGLASRARRARRLCRLPLAQPQRAQLQPRRPQPAARADGRGDPGSCLVGPGFLGYAPKFALGGALIFAGARLLRRWIVQSARQLHLIEYPRCLRSR